MARLRSLLANAHRALSEPIIPAWPVELLQTVDAMVFSMREGGAPPVDVMGQSAQDIQFWESFGHAMQVAREAPAFVDYRGAADVPNKLREFAASCQSKTNR